jgi:hypothetical protein
MKKPGGWRVGTVAALSMLMACGLTSGSKVVTVKALQGATYTAFTTQQMALMYASMTLDLVGNTSFTCPTVSPSTPQAASYTFDFGSGCTPNPQVLFRGPVAGSATVAVSGNTLTVSFANLSYAGVVLNGSATVTASGTSQSRTLTINGTYRATYDGVTYTLTFTNFVATGSLNGSALSLTTSGTVSISDGVGTLSLTASNLVVTPSGISGTVTVSTSSGYLAITLTLNITASANGIVVSSSIAGVPFSFNYPW